MKTDQLSLYQFPSCPFCQRVFEAIKRLDLDIELRDTRATAAYREELLAGTGRTMVPCLRIDEAQGPRWLPESADIIAFLEREFGG